MTVGTSSCRPGRLQRFDEAMDAAADGLAHRRGSLEDALAAYRAGCSVDYRIPTVGTDDVVRSFGGSLRDWGHWVGHVGQAFLEAAAVNAYMGGYGTTDPEDVMTFTDADVLEHLRESLDEGEDPFRGIPEGMAAQLALDLGVEYDQDGPPAWLDYIDTGGNVADVATNLLSTSAKVLAGLPPELTVSLRIEGGAIILLENGNAIGMFVAADLQARLRIPVGSASGLADAARWVDRAGMGLDFAGGFAGQWIGDEGLPLDERVGRSVTRGGSAALGGWAGGLAAGAAAGTVCGPGAPVCSTALGIGGAVVGGLLGEKAADFLPWMDSNEPLPGEHDLGDLTDTIAGDDGIDLAIAAGVDLAASDMALAASADEPAFQSRVASILPDRERLEYVAAVGERPEDVTTTGTTTTTTTSTTTTTTSTTVPEPGPATGTTTATVPLPGPEPRDPWPSHRPYE